MIIIYHNSFVYLHKRNGLLHFYMLSFSYYALMNPMFVFCRNALNHTVFGYHLVPAVDS